MISPQIFCERPIPWLIFSTSHDSAHKSGVSTPKRDGCGGLHEREMSRSAAAGISQACDQMGVRLWDLCGEPVDNWASAVALADQAKREGARSLALELHMNSGGPASIHGCLLQYPTQFAAHDLVDILRPEMVARIPPHHWVGSVPMPSPGYLNWAFLRSMQGRASVLIELGFVEDPAFCAWIDVLDNQMAVGKFIGQACCDWLLKP